MMRHQGARNPNDTSAAAKDTDTDQNRKYSAANHRNTSILKSIPGHTVNEVK